MNNRVIEHHGRIYLQNLCAKGQRAACLALQRAPLKATDRPR
jgi:hypothetical protein